MLFLEFSGTFEVIVFDRPFIGLLHIVRVYFTGTKTRQQGVYLILGQYICHKVFSSI
jgi:hypothetical protein